MEQEFWTDIYQFKQYFGAPVNDERYWQELLRVSGILNAKYYGAEFNKTGIVKKMILDIVGDLEKRFYEMSQGQYLAA